MDYWVRVGIGDPPPPSGPLPDGEPRWVRASARAVAVTAPPSAVRSESDTSDLETRKTWLVDSFEIVAPRYPWQKADGS
ncbi:hypothetical protein F4560_006852 [Saccharothrix ecbatanensis]|uniref:Uncharacterized protein n=1 Tax=Saccharothrix ecbatanensis TaxID=1105145 RepID=A0A7W9HSC7_9PSEU|nr:hypothetical protein [Saccharothrix ecbatanensis]MBB5807084.1 hypothetical protein [Saccharothrix ecbatanensis]